MRIQCCGQGAVNDIGTLDNVTGADLLLVLGDPLANAHMDIANWTQGDTGGHRVVGTQGDTGGTRGDRKSFYITEQNVQDIGSNKYFQHGECVDKKLYLSCFDDL